MLNSQDKICCQKSDRSNFENEYQNVWWKQIPQWIIIDNKANLKSCLFPIQQLGEIKNSHEPSAGRNFFFQSLCQKRYTRKRFKKIAADTVKMLLSIYVYSIFMLIHLNLIIMIDINQNPVLCSHTNKNYHLNILNNPWANSLLELTDPLRFPMYCDRGW